MDLAVNFYKTISRKAMFGIGRTHNTNSSYHSFKDTTTNSLPKEHSDNKAPEDRFLNAHQLSNCDQDNTVAQHSQSNFNLSNKLNLEKLARDVIAIPNDSLKQRAHRLSVNQATTFGGLKTRRHQYNTFHKQGTEKLSRSVDLVADEAFMERVKVAQKTIEKGQQALVKLHKFRLNPSLENLAKDIAVFPNSAIKKRATRIGVSPTIVRTMLQELKAIQWKKLLENTLSSDTAYPYTQSCTHPLNDGCYASTNHSSVANLEATLPLDPNTQSWIDQVGFEELINGNAITDLVAPSASTNVQHQAVNNRYEPIDYANSVEASLNSTNFMELEPAAASVDDAQVATGILSIEEFINNTDFSMLDSFITSGTGFTGDEFDFV